MRRFSLWAMMAAAVAIPLTLLWDYSWESTVGVDYVWAAPHVAGYAAVLVAALAAALMIQRGVGDGVAIGKWTAPLGAWVVLWGAVAFVTAFTFDQWWQTSYGLVAGIWHPPQILKAVAFFAILLGAYLAAPVRIRPWAGGAILLMIFVVTLPSNFANRQHGAPFYLLSCAIYPGVLAALSMGGGSYVAARAALVYTLLAAALIWLLPMIPGEPLAAPIFNPRDRLLPPPFPLLLVAPALAMDLFARAAVAKRDAAFGWAAALELALAFAVTFGAVQWLFSAFLLSPAADNAFFAGGGRHWPFSLQIAPELQQAFWILSPEDALTAGQTAAALLLALGSARAGLFLARGVRALRR